MTFYLLVVKIIDIMRSILMELLITIFGLSSNGTNGGQTGVSPSLDAIEQFQVSVSPFDVKLSAGGSN
jgi:hypothetical protein